MVDHSQQSLHTLDVFNLLLHRHLGLCLLPSELSTASMPVPLNHGH